MTWPEARRSRWRPIPTAPGDWKALRALRRAGFNRLSLGVQSTDDALLRRIGRVHTYEQVQQAVTAARKAKIENLSLDLIYGLPDQTMEDWQRTLADAVALGPGAPVLLRAEGGGGHAPVAAAAAADAAG